MVMNLKSTVNDVGDVVTQVIHFENGEEKTFEHIIPSTIKVGAFTKFGTTDGKLVSVAHKKVVWFETHKEL